MPRVRALVLLGLFLVNQAACTIWQVPKVTPQEYLVQHPYKDIRITPKDVDGKQQRSVVLRGIRFSGDSILGNDHRGQPVAYSLQHVATFEVRHVNGALTVFAVLGIGLVAFVGFAIVVCSGGGCTPQGLSFQ